MASSGRKSPKRWTEEEDALLYHEFTRLSDPNEITDWSRIAEGVPGRSNKDCRKRWVNKVCGGLNKGPWSREEDQRLRNAMDVHGSKWTRVAEEVASRSADQCAKRWQQSLDPSIKHGNWTEEEDERLIRAVEKHGRQWKQIQETYYQSRSRNDLKNRYTIITRRASNSDNAASRPSTATLADTGEVSLTPTSSTSGASHLTPTDEYTVDYSHSRAFPMRPYQHQQALGSTPDYWRPTPPPTQGDSLTSWSSSYGAPMTSAFSDPTPEMLPWSQHQVPPNFQAALDGQYYPADDATSVHDHYYQTPLDTMTGNNNNMNGSVSSLSVANTGDFDDELVTDYDRETIYNPFMYNTQ
ncbi:Homeodomain-like protein [Apiospora arundinis]